MAVDLEKARKRLLKERAHYLRDKSRLAESGDEQYEVDELTDVDFNHPADAGTETFMRELDLTLTDEVRAVIAQIDDALARVDAGTYGMCARCGKHISEARLRDLPHAIYCIDCQRFIEDTE